MDDQAGELICGYGDIRTSLTFVDAPGVANAEDYLIALSPIIWPLTNAVTIKYVTIVLFANGDGEGGTFALYSLITGYVCFPFCPHLGFWLR